MTTEQEEADQYRFSGYQLPKVQLDETGDSYIVLHPHPYYYNQPLYWQKEALVGNQLPATGVIAPKVPIEPSGSNAYPNENNLFKMLPPC